MKKEKIAEKSFQFVHLTKPTSHGIKGFVIQTKSFVKTGITKTFCYSNKMFSSINKTFGCCSKIFGCSNKKFICCPSFCCRNKTIFFSVRLDHKIYELQNSNEQKDPNFLACFF